MVKKYWIKLYVELLRDPKMGVLSDNLWRRFVECLLLAGDTGEDGFLPPVNFMAWLLHEPETTLQNELEQLAKYNLVEVRQYDLFEHRWYVTHFEKRQAPSDAAERQRLHRDRQQKKDSPRSPLKEKEENQEEDQNTQNTYCYVTSVTKRDNIRDKPEDPEHAAKVDAYWRTALQLVKDWCKLTRNFQRLDSRNKDHQSHYYAPALGLVDLFEGDGAAAWQAIKAEYERMIGDGLTIKRLEAVTAGVAAAVHRASLPVQNQTGNGKGKMSNADLIAAALETI